MRRFARRIIRRRGLDLVLHVEEGEGPLAFFQHGLCGDAAQPASVFPEGTGFRLAVLDCRGHGESPAGDLDALSIASFAADVSAAIAETCGIPCVVGGISMGAAIAMRIACLRPELVSGLIVARPAWFTAAAPRNMAPNLEVGRILSAPRRDGEENEFLASPTGRRLAADAPDNLASLRSFFQRRPREVTASLLSRISAEGPGITREQLAALDVPTLVIGHGEDVIHPLPLARDIAAAIPRAQFAEIPSKARDKAAYEAAFRAELSRFLEEMP